MSGKVVARCWVIRDKADGLYVAFDGNDDNELFWSKDPASAHEFGQLWMAREYCDGETWAVYRRGRRVRAQGARGGV